MHKPPHGARPGEERDHATTLENYWRHGEGATKIRWGTPGDWTRCYRELTRRVGDDPARRICPQWHHDTTGLWPRRPEQPVGGHRMPWNTSNRAKCLPPNWPILRATILRRDNGICHVCGKHGAEAYLMGWRCDCPKLW
ncbi:hypothetical protein [Streptomyces odontomachi]|uniref:hypothetical protein n=1 Tax=Streptomyces odontomachi TaxID=2944940 RepID=UPI00210D4F12|nr:hypothetical protein [Streptomyces sp. ODS25]